jgi:hypothetical protein
MRKHYLRFGLISAFLGFTLLLLPGILSFGQTADPVFDQADQQWFNNIRANQQTGVVNPSDVSNANLQAQKLADGSSRGALNLNWKSTGPDNYPGLVWSAIFDNKDASASTIIAGTEGGGIWKSTNLGLTWIIMPVENNEVLKVSSIVQTSNGTIYAATGLSSCKSVNTIGSGIYKSENNSVFTVIPSTRSNPDFIGITKLAINKTSGRIFAATAGGVYYSDNGNDWTKVKSGYAMDVCVGPDGTVIAAVGDSAYLSVGGSLDSWVTLTTGKTGQLPKTGTGWMVFAIAPSDANVMYASVVSTQPDSKMVNVYASFDKGTTWSIIFPGNPAYEPYSGAGCYSNTIAVFPDDPGKLYLGGRNMWLGRKIQSSGYYNWEMVSFGSYSPWVPSSAPQYHHSYMFRPGNSNQIVIATDGGVSLATDGANGLEFFTSNKNLSTSQFYSVAFSSEKHMQMGGGRNIGSLALGYFYPTFTNSLRDGWPLQQPLGLLIGANGGTGVWSNLNHHIGIFTIRTATTSIFQRQDFRDLTYDNDVMNGLTSIYTTSYSPMQLWESFKFSQSKDSVKFFTYGKGIPADTVIQIESKNGITFDYHTMAPIAKGDSITVVDPVASRFFVYANKATTNYGYGIYMTKDMLRFNKPTEYFVVCKDTATKVDLITSFAVSTDLNTLWAGTAKGRLIRIKGLVNAHDSVTANEYSTGCVLVKDIYPAMPFLGQRVTSISINPTNVDQVLVTLGNYGNENYVYYSTNAGSASPVFNSVQSNLPKAPIYSGLIELHGNNAIVGTDIGVFSTTNLSSGNPDWGADMANIGNVIVTDMRQQTLYDYHIMNYGVIYMASYGRGLWMEDSFYAPVGQEEITKTVATDQHVVLTPNPASDLVQVSFRQNVSGMVQVTLYDITGRVVLNHQVGFVQKGDARTSINVSAIPAGSYLVKVGSAVGKLIRK